MILDYKHRDELLKSVYQNKEMYIFVCGKEWFDNKILGIWEEWLKYEIPTHSNAGLDTPEFHKMCWEMDNNFLIEVI